MGFRLQASFLAFGPLYRMLMAERRREKGRKRGKKEERERGRERG